MAAAGFLAYWITARVGGRRKPREIGTKVPDAAFLERARKEAPFHKTTSKQLFVWEALVAWLPKQAAKMREIADAAERTGAFVGDEPGDFHALVCGVLRYHVEDERVYSGLLNVAYTRDPATQRFVLTDGTLRKAAAYIDGLDGKLVPWGMKRDVNTHSALSAGGTLGPPG